MVWSLTGFLTSHPGEWYFTSVPVCQRLYIFSGWRSVFSLRYKLWSPLLSCQVFSEIKRCRWVVQHSCHSKAKSLHEWGYVVWPCTVSRGSASVVWDDNHSAYKLLICTAFCICIYFFHDSVSSYIITYLSKTLSVFRRNVFESQVKWVWSLILQWFCDWKIKGFA